MRFIFLGLTVGLMSLCPMLIAQDGPDEGAYLSWSADQAEAIVKSMRSDGRAGGLFDFRVTRTERSYNYRLRATWLTPRVIRASARFLQLHQSLSDEETRALVTEAEVVGDIVMMIEIDPRE